MSRLPPLPDLEWNADNAPHARAFGDIYFSARGGLAESEAVFLAGCDLPRAWRDRSRFAICELGFGTGLNALAVWRAWRQTRAPGAVLHFCSVEAFPLAREDAARALSAFPEISNLSERLLARWPVRAYAPQRIWFPDDGFALTVFVGDAAQVLSGMSGAFDAWFLDGFAPSRNEAMWSDAVFAEMARLSTPGARAATFSVAGHVRRGLEAAGFSVERKPGFANKRERLEAAWSAGVSPANANPLYPYAAAHPKRVAIIGAGIAGAACARALARRGVETVVLDEAAELAAGASGNPGGLVMPRLDRGDGPARELFLAAYLDAVAAYGELGVLEPCGVLEHADPRHTHVLADMLADPPLPEDWYRAASGGALHVRAGVVRPREAIRAWLSGAELMCGAEVAALERVGEGWLLRAPDSRAWLRADAVVLACGAALTRFEAACFLPVNLSRGQIEWGALDGAAPAHAELRSSYAAPFEDGVLFGATFDPVEAEDDGTARARNLAALTELSPDIAARIRPDTLSSRAALRATPKDYMPVAGLLPRAEDWLARFAGLAHGRVPDLGAPAPAHAGLYVLGGLGARGLTLAPLLGERIAAEMFGEPLPLSLKTLDATHPARFLHRALRRGG